MGEYIGDDLWAWETDRGQIALTADPGTDQERTVYLEPQVYLNLASFAADVWPSLVA